MNVCIFETYFSEILFKCSELYQNRYPKGPFDAHKVGLTLWKSYQQTLRVVGYLFLSFFCHFFVIWFCIFLSFLFCGVIFFVIFLSFVKSFFVIC